MKVKVLVYALTVLTSISVVGCSWLKSDVIDIDGLKVAYIVKDGGLSDKSVGELGYIGLKRAEQELKVKGYTLEGNINEPEAFEKEIKNIAERSELIIMNGSDLAELSVEVSAMFRDKKIVIIGANKNETNIQDINFKDEEGGFLMGIIAGKSTKTNKIGFMALEDNDDTKRLISGFIAGVKVVNEKAAENLLSGKDIIYTNKQANEEMIYKTAKDYIGNGVDIIFEKLSTEEIGALKAAKEDNIKVIGVGTDKYEYYPEYKDVILSSMIKCIDDIVFDLVNQTQKGIFKSGDNNSVMIDLKSGKLNYAKSTEINVSNELLNEVESYKKQIIDKKLKVPGSIIEVLEYKK